MILYLDTSALVKLYVDEPMSHELAVAVDEAEAIATSPLAYTERMPRLLVFVAKHGCPCKLIDR